MDLEEAKVRFELSDKLVARIQAYYKKVKNAEVKYCIDCTREWYDFESDECPNCQEEEG